jgi:branched-subunit amino acid transport protein AzlD
MYTLLGILIIALFSLGGFQIVVYETSPARGSMAGLAVAVILLYGVIACVALGVVALLTLPFYIMARKKVAQNIAKAPEKKVHIGVIAAVIVFGSVFALIALITASFIGI